MSKLTLVSSAKCFGGWQNVYSHSSVETNCEMKFGVYFPPSINLKEKKATNGQLPVIYFLSGLTCTEQNFIVKSGFQRYAAQLNVIVVNPDTSPRNCNIEGEDTDWDFGTGAGFYVDATVEPYAKHYRMFSYVNKELIALIESEFSNYIAPNQRVITGHSMGGHGALISGLRNPNLYKAVGAFAPISNPSVTPWGIKCLGGYLGDNKEEWKNWDACCLVNNYKGPDLHVRVDQGTGDPYLEKELKAESLVDAFNKASLSLKCEFHQDYEHGYMFVGTFIEEHFKHLLEHVKRN